MMIVASHDKGVDPIPMLGNMSIWMGRERGAGTATKCRCPKANRREHQKVDNAESKTGCRTLDLPRLKGSTRELNTVEIGYQSKQTLTERSLSMFGLRGHVENQAQPSSVCEDTL